MMVFPSSGITNTINQINTPALNLHMAVPMESWNLFGMLEENDAVHKEEIGVLVGEIY